MTLSKIFSSLLAAYLMLAGAPRARANNAGAVVLVNSQSGAFLDFQHFIQPYLDNFGVPYTVIDIASNTVGTNLANYALIIIGHAQLDTNHSYLNAAAQSNISLAVSNGVGLVNFDDALAAGNTPLYQFEQDIFGFGYTNAVTGPSVVFPPTEPGVKMHYVTALHSTNETLVLSNANNTTTMTVAGLTLPTNATAVATCGGAPLVVVERHGLGRAVQWTSYRWISTSIQGPVNGMDDLVWRGLVWSARKPFVMRGLPNFVTMRVDDVQGPFGWVHDAVDAGFKPFLALFTDDITAVERNTHDGRTADLRGLVTNGQVTASMHSFSATLADFFYFDHVNGAPYSDSVMASNYTRGTQWLQANGIPSSKVVVAHWGEAGPNAFAGLTNWGVEYFMIMVVPGTRAYFAPYAPWLMGGPYRLYETPGQGQAGLPFFYADFLTIPGHPELNGKFFNCCTEIHNVGVAQEWAPTNDVAGSVARGVATLKRSLDSMTLATVYTHEFYIQVSDGPIYGTITTSNWQAILQGITNTLAPYSPLYVTMDYAAQYLRATRTSQLTAADYEPATGRVSASFTGKTDLPINAYFYTGEDAGITSASGTVPTFSGATNVTLGSAPVPAQIRNAAVVNGVLSFNLLGQYGRSYGIDGSSDLLNWTQIETATLSNGSVLVNYPLGATNLFLRARLLP